MYMKKILLHLFLPQETNNYRPRILHHKILLVLTLFFFSAGFLMSFLRTNFPSVLGTFSDISSDQLLILTNQKRQEVGAAPLLLNSVLSQAAIGKANDMFSKNYWAHIAPDGTTPWVFIKAAGYNYIYAGENLARGFTTPSDVVNAWMASAEHKKNMLSTNYKDVGFAIQTGSLNGEETVLVVEMFGSTYLAPPAVATANPVTPTPAIVAAGSPESLSIPVTPTPTLIPTPTVAAINTLGSQKSNIAKATENQTIKPLINSATFSRYSSRIVISIFIFILLLDLFIIERRKIVRFVGHNLDHVFFFTLMLIIILILARGAII